MSHRAWLLVRTAGLAGCLAVASANAEPVATDPAHDDGPGRSCLLKRDGAACAEADPIFQEAMEQVNQQRAREAQREASDRNDQSSDRAPAAD